MNWRFYKDQKGKWRWRAISTDNKLIVGASTQGYARRIDCLNNALLFGYQPPL